MSQSKEFPFHNRLLAAMSPDDLALVQPHLEREPLERRKVLETRGRPVDNVWFIEQGLASVVSSGGGDHRAETSLIGSDGVTGSCIIHEADLAAHEMFIQVAGHGLRLNADQLRRAMAESPSLRRLLLRYVHTLMMQMSGTALANAEAKLEERLARWLLMAHDRAIGDELPLVHEFLALMLGVRRSGVTVALHELRRRGLIDNERGRIAIIDREGLETLVGGFFGQPEAEYRRLIG